MFIPSTKAAPAPHLLVIVLGRVILYGGHNIVQVFNVDKPDGNVTLAILGATKRAQHKWLPSMSYLSDWEQVSSSNMME